MRAADAVTYFRVAVILFVAYLIIEKVNPIAIALLIAFAMLLDAFDGYAAVWEGSGGRISLIDYIRAAASRGAYANEIKKIKLRLARTAKHGPRIDVAGDRVVEYVLWIVYTYVAVIPLYVLFAVVIRHSFVDALMANRGTSSKMKTKLAKVVYSSSIGRGGINVVKFLAFSYLAFAYIWGWNIAVGYLLVAVLVAYIMVRGIAEAYESMQE
ncbi:MAG: CDP-alcohol phosphatidyltransferase family protein [Candidatus Micrarchaeaceae archaeon]